MSNPSLSFGYSPFPDEIFMLHGLLEGKLNEPDYDFEFIQADIDTLNEHSLSGELDLSSISIRAYAELSNHYDLLSSGARFAHSVGPLLVSREKLSRNDVKSGPVAVPGRLTTATLLLKLYAGNNVNIEQVPHDQIPEQISRGNFKAGVVIDETLLDIYDTDLTTSLNFSKWWRSNHRLPLPLGCVCVKNDRDDGRRLANIVAESVRYGLNNPTSAIAEAAKNDPGRDPEQLETFINQFVSDLSIEMGSRGRRAIQTLLNEAYEAGIIDGPVNPVFIQSD